MAKMIHLQTESENPTWEQCLEEFIFWKKAQGVSLKTIEDYYSHVKRFFNRFPEGWQSNELKQSVYRYMSDNIKPATYNLRLVYLRAFFQWCVDEHYLIKNPLTGFKRRKASGRLVNISEDILKQLLSLPDLETFSGLRDYALIMLTLDTGIRPSEALSLKIHNFDFKHFNVTIPSESAKTRVERCLPMLKVTTEIIKRLISVRHVIWEQEAPVFCSCDGKKMNRHSWNQRLEYYSHRLGTKIRAYDLRHCFALMYLRNGGHAFGLQLTLGHTDIQMTRRYVNLSGQDIKECHSKASPLNHLIPSQKESFRLRKI